MKKVESALFDNFPNGTASRLIAVVGVVLVLILACIGIVQVLKTRGIFLKMRTEALALIISASLYFLVYFIGYILIAHNKFVFTELVIFVAMGVFMGTVSSLVAEKLFRQKK